MVMENLPAVWKEMRRMQRDMDSLFEDLLEDSFFRFPRISNLDYRVPATDIYETEKEVVYEMELPGVDKKDIKVNIINDGLEVKAEVTEQRKHIDKAKGVYRYERNYSGFYRRYPVPKNVDVEKASAEYKDGVLKIVLPKLEPEKGKESRTIDVK